MQIPKFIKEEFEKKQAQNKSDLLKRKQSVREKTTEIDEIEVKKRKLAFELGHNAFSDFGDTYEQDRPVVEQKIKELEDEKKRILEKYGFPPDYLEMKYSCKNCCDTGYIQNTNIMCTCMKNRIMKYHYASYDMNEDECFENYDLSVFRDERQKKTMKRVYDFALQYADALPTPKPLNIIILGSAGLGKSFTLNCIAHRAMERGLEVVKTTAYNMFEAIVESIRGDRLMPDYISCDLLIIDDLGTEPMMKNITVEKLFYIINEREARGKATAIASNLSKGDIMQHYDERVGSRLMTPKFNAVINLSGTDVRLQL